MHNLAIAMQSNGYEVSGSDDEIFEPSKSRLKKYGLLPQEMGWYPEKLSQSIDFIILGMHAKADNPELQYAQDKGLKIYSYPEFLFHHAEEKLRVVIGGSHGKTTITAMVMHVLKQCGKEFDYLVGSKLRDFDVMVQLSSKAPMMVFEGDEYLSSPIDRRPKFHWYKPQLALLSGIAWDHINVFPSFEFYLDQFRIFISQLETGQSLVYNEEDPHLRQLVADVDSSINCIPYGLPTYEIADGLSQIIYKTKKYPLSVFGKHNLMNIKGAQLLCKELGIAGDQFYTSMGSFKGTDNRLELILKKESGVLYKDFAHAPSKVKATTEAMREQYPDSHLIACLELHTFSSLNKSFLHEYKGSLDLCDQAFVYFNPHALKMKAMDELDAADIKEAFDNEQLMVFSDSRKLRKALMDKKTDKKAILMMSSGNFDGLDMNDLADSLLC